MPPGVSKCLLLLCPHGLPQGPGTCVLATLEVLLVCKLLALLFSQSVRKGCSFCRNSVLPPLPPLLSQACAQAKLRNTCAWRPFLPLSLGQSPPRLPWPPAPLATELSTRPSPPQGRGRRCCCFRNQKRRHLVEVFFKR